MQVNAMRMLYTHATKGDNSIIFWQLLPTEASLIAMPMFILLLATTVESLLRQSEFD
jgi:hypothetical protein